MTRQTDFFAQFLQLLLARCELAHCRHRDLSPRWFGWVMDVWDRRWPKPYQTCGHRYGHIFACIRAGLACSLAGSELIGALDATSTLCAGGCGGGWAGSSSSSSSCRARVLRRFAFRPVEEVWGEPMVGSVPPPPRPRLRSGWVEHTSSCEALESADDGHGHLSLCHA